MSVPGPCEPEDLIDGIIFAANYLGSTQLLSERNPSKNIRMMQAQEAVSRVKVGAFRVCRIQNTLWSSDSWSLSSTDSAASEVHLRVYGSATVIPSVSSAYYEETYSIPEEHHLNYSRV